MRGGADAGGHGPCGAAREPYLRGRALDNLGDLVVISTGPVQNRGMEGLDELDLQLISALQVAPRAAWVDLAPIIGLSPGAAASRWRRITDEGYAWVTAGPAVRLERPLTGIAVVQVKGARFAEAEEAISRDPRVMGVDELSVMGQLMLTVCVPTLDAMNQLAQHELPAIPGVKVRDVWIVMGLIREGADWRLDALDADQRRRATPLADTNDGATAPRRTRKPSSTCSPRTPACPPRRSRGGSTAIRGRCAARCRA